MAMVCPITNTDRDNPLHVRLSGKCAVSGMVMIDHVKSVDYTARHARFIEKASAEVLREVLAILDACIYDE